MLDLYAVSYLTILTSFIPFWILLFRTSVNANEKILTVGSLDSFDDSASFRGSLSEA